MFSLLDSFQRRPGSRMDLNPSYAGLFVNDAGRRRVRELFPEKAVPQAAYDSFCRSRGPVAAKPSENRGVVVALASPDGSPAPDRGDLNLEAPPRRQEMGAELVGESSHDKVGLSFRGHKLDRQTLGANFRHNVLIHLPFHW